MNKTVYAVLQISSFDGLTPDAKHYYGTIVCNGERYELLRKLNKNTVKEFIKDFHVVGGMTSRFDSEDHVIRHAKKTWKKLYPDAQFLLMGSSACLDPQQCIDGPPKLKAKINYYYKQAEKIGWYGGNEKAMTKLSDEYMKDVLKWK